MKFAILCILAVAAIIAGAPTKRRDSGWMRIPKGTSWSLQAWCNSGSCNDRMDGKRMVTINWYYVDAAKIKAVKADGHIATCYMSAGAVLPSEKAKTPGLPLGRRVSGWDLTYLDITEQDAVRNFMVGRLRDAADKGCDAVELDNVDCWQNDCVPGMKPYDERLKATQIDYLRWLANTAHRYGMAVGMKNSLPLITSLVDLFDFAVNESCHQFKECYYLKPFLEQGKGVFGTEYHGDPWKICNEARSLGMIQKYDLNHKGWRDC